MPWAHSWTRTQESRSSTRTATKRPQTLFESEAPFDTVEEIFESLPRGGDELVIFEKVLDSVKGQRTS